MSYAQSSCPTDSTSPFGGAAARPALIREHSSDCPLPTVITISFPSPITTTIAEAQKPRNINSSTAAVTNHHKGDARRHRSTSPAANNTAAAASTTPISGEGRPASAGSGGPHPPHTGSRTARLQPVTRTRAASHGSARVDAAIFAVRILGFEAFIPALS